MRSGPVSANRREHEPALLKSFEVAGLADSVLDTVSHREAVLVDTARRSGNAFGWAFAESWSTASDNWHYRVPPPRELLVQLAEAAPAAVDQYRRRGRWLLELLRAHLATLEILPTLAGCVLTDVRRREESRLEGGDDTLEPEIELLAGLMLAPGSAPVVRRPPIGRDIDQVLLAALRVHAYAELAESARHVRDGGTHQANLRGTLRTTYFGVRGTAYVRHSDDLARRLLGGRDGRWFLERFKFEIDDVIAVREANRVRWQRAVRGLIDRANEEARQAGADERGTRGIVHARVLEELDDAMAVRLDRLEDDLSGVDPRRASAVLAELSCDVDATWRLDDVDSESPLLCRPWVRDGDRALLVLPGRFDTELIALFESKLLRSSKRFSRRRARAVDVEAVLRLGSVLPGSTQYVGLRYGIPEAGQGGDPDIDGLVLYQDVAIVVEGKASQLSPQARRGDLKRLAADLESITKAWKQAQRDVRLLCAGRPADFRDEDGKAVRVHPHEARSTYVVLPTLHPLTNWCLQPRDLVGLAVLPPGAFPWVVSITDLRVVTDSVRRPAELVAYLNWREEVLAQGRVLVPDEIELFGAFLRGIDLAAPPEDDDAQLLVIDMQAEFDDYHQRLRAGDPAATPPAKRITPLVEEHLAWLEQHQPPGWLRQSVECLIAPYAQLCAVEAAAPVLSGRLSGGEVAVGLALGDAAIVCFHDHERLDHVRSAAKVHPSLSHARRTFFFALGNSVLRLTAVEAASPSHET